MRRLVAGGFLIAMMTVASSMVAAHAVRTEMDIRKAPRAPRIYLNEEPRFVEVIPDQSVFLLENSPGDLELYRYGRYYYLLSNGYWYRGTSYHGPFQAIRGRYVPGPVMAAVHARPGDRVEVAVTSAPPPPRVLVRRTPVFTLVPGTTVYRWEQHPASYQLYRHRGDYYLLSRGYWYKGASVHGPFVVIRETVVPQQVFVAGDNDRGTHTRTIYRRHVVKRYRG